MTTVPDFKLMAYVKRKDSQFTICTVNACRIAGTDLYNLDEISAAVPGFQFYINELMSLPYNDNHLDKNHTILVKDFETIHTEQGERLIATVRLNKCVEITIEAGEKTIKQIYQHLKPASSTLYFLPNLAFQISVPLCPIFAPDYKGYVGPD